MLCCSCVVVVFHNVYNCRIMAAPMAQKWLAECEAELNSALIQTESDQRPNHIFYAHVSATCPPLPAAYFTYTHTHVRLLLLLSSCFTILALEG